MSKRANGEGSVYKQDFDGRWVAAITLPNGNRKRFTAATQQEALQKRKTWEEQNKGLPPVADERLTLDKFLTEWLKTIQPTVRASTYRGYESKLRMHVIPELGNRRLTNLSVQTLEAFFNAKARAGLSPRTVHHLRAILRAALNDAVKWNLARRNPATSADTPRIPEAEPQPMTPTEARAIVECVTGDRFGPLCLVALASGLRQGELLGLRWQDIDFDAGNWLCACRCSALTTSGSLANRRQRAAAHRVASRDGRRGATVAKGATERGSSGVRRALGQRQRLGLHDGSRAAAPGLQRDPAIAGVDG